GSRTLGTDSRARRGAKRHRHGSHHRNAQEVVLYRPILQWGPPLDEGLSARWIGLHFFFSFGLSYLKAAKKASLAGAPEVGTKTSCRPRFHCAEWSCGVLSDPPRLRIKTGKD